MARYKWCAALAATYLIAAGFAGCGGASSSPQAAKTTIRVEGSDTMLMLAQAWAEGYSRTHPNVSMQVSGGGSGVGIASLIEGAADMANASRKMTDQERQKAKAMIESQSILISLGPIGISSTSCRGNANANFGVAGAVRASNLS